MTSTISQPGPPFPPAAPRPPGPSFPPAAPSQPAPPAVLSTRPEAITAAREYAESVASGVIERDRAGAVPAAEIAAFDASGLLAITVPREHGGPELPASVLAEVIRVIAVVDPALAQVPQAHYLFTDVLATWGTDAQQRRLFADVLSGGRFGNGLAERGGKHAQDLKTRLHATGSRSRLSGRKYYCTGAITARWIGVSAIDDGGHL